MGELTTAVFKKGIRGYWAIKAQSAELVSPTAITDPTVVTGVSTRVGIGPVAAWDLNENTMPLEGAGSYRDLGEIGRRREIGCRANLQITNGTFLANAIRDLEDVGSTTRKGLPLFTTDIAWAGDGGGNAQLLDCLVNGLVINAAEMQYLTADLDIWAIAARAGSTPAIPTVSTPADVLRWEQLAVSSDTQGGDDLMPILQSVRVSVNNGLRRVGMREQLFSGSDELAISRTARTILPTMEKIQVQYTLRAGSPVDSNVDWGSTVLLASNGATPTPQVCEIIIDHSYASRVAQNQVGPNEVLTYAVDAAAFGIGIYDSVQV